MIVDNTIIIGAGISGLGASYTLRNKGLSPIILEKDETYGGLAGNFTISKGFRFDRFVHFSFTNDETVNDIFAKSTNGEIFHHKPNPFNLYNGKWIKHPAQNNLYPLPKDEKDLMIQDFKQRPSKIDTTKILNYEEWLRAQYGDSFAEHFPMVYTRKYWMSEAKDLETRWIGNRLYQPSIEEVIEGANKKETPVTYYAKEMRYPVKGGFKKYLSELVRNADIRYNSEVSEIDIENKSLITETGEKYNYNRLISSMPLPSLISKLNGNVPSEVSEAASKLKCTSGYQISIALNNNNIPPFLWWYIYDPEILPARVFSPSLKSPDNVPEGCSSLQLEVYCHKNDYTENNLVSKSINPLIELGIIREDDIITVDVRFEPWANVIFDHNIYKARKTVIDFIRSLGIEPIGRFGLWDYLWSDQALKTGLRIE